MIRTATIEHGVAATDRELEDVARDEHDVVTIRAGAGIVADSDPTAEYEETEKKMGGVLDAIERVTEPPEASR